MTIASAPLNLLAFPQGWDHSTKTLSVRFLCLPRGNPLAPLAKDLHSFATANLKFQGRLIGSLANVPLSAESQPAPTLVLTPSPTATPKETLFQKLAATVHDRRRRSSATRRPARVPQTGDRRLPDPHRQSAAQQVHGRRRIRVRAQQLARKSAAPTGTPSDQLAVGPSHRIGRQAAQSGEGAGPDQRNDDQTARQLLRTRRMALHHSGSHQRGSDHCRAHRRARRAHPAAVGHHQPRHLHAGTVPRRPPELGGRTTSSARRNGTTPATPGSCTGCRTSRQQPTAMPSN